MNLRPDLFSHVNVECNSLCNLRCKTCPVSIKKRPFAELSNHALQSIVADLKQIGYSGNFSPHFYNEPLLDLRLIEFLSFTKKNLPQVTISLFSNFTRMTPETFRRLCASTDRFVATIDETAIWESVSRLMSNITPDERKRIVTRSLHRVGLSNRAGLIAASHEALQKPRQCIFALQHIDIDAFGNVHLCCNDYEGRAVFGNIYEKGLVEIWQAPEYVRVRRDISEGRPGHPLCADCTWVFA